jgi:acetyltransferase-like isoleucine patch superfamily enzyme
MSRPRIRRLLAVLVGYCPTNTLRCFFYSYLMGYRLGANVRLGWGTVVAVNEFVAGANVTIRRGNTFVGPVTVELGERTFIGRYNKIECGDSAVDPKVAHMGYSRRFVTGANSLINEGHLFDVLGTLSIGNGTWIAGFDSQFLTHGAGTMNRDIKLGDDCFVGSAVRFAPGAGVGDRVIVGIGAVVTKQLPENNVVVGGFPAKVIKIREADDEYHFEKQW